MRQNIPAKGSYAPFSREEDDLTEWLRKNIEGFHIWGGVSQDVTQVVKGPLSLDYITWAAE